MQLITLDSLNLWWAKTQFSAGKRASAYRKLSVMLRNGVRIERALDDLHRRASDDGNKPNEGMAILYDSWRSVVRNGGRFADAIQGWVPYNELMMIRAGEAAGKLPETIDSVVRVVKCSRAITSAVRGGFIYPAFLLMAVIGYIYLFGVHVIPQFARVLDPAKWSAIARSLYLMSKYVQSYGLLTIFAIVMFLVCVGLSFGRLTGNVRVKLDKIEPWATYRMVVGAGFLLALSTLVSGGQRIQDALLSLGGLSTPYIKERLDGFLLGVNSGLSAGDAMIQSGYDFPSKDIVDDIAVYVEHSGDYATSLSLIATEWLEEGVDIIKAKMEWAKYMAILIIAVILMWIISGMIAMQQDIGAMARGG